MLPQYPSVLSLKHVEMGRKGKNTSFDLRQLIIFHRGKAKSYRDISSLLKISKSTVADIVRRFEDEDRIDFIPQTGRPAALTAREKRGMVRKIKANPRSSVPKLAAEHYEETGTRVHPETIRRTLRQHGYNDRVCRKKPFINEAKRKKRVFFAREFISKEESWWDNVTFADESKFNIHNSDGRRMVWRKANKEFHHRNT
ncbi:PREDICTED: uncharacterized protein LOC108547048 [Eufriesea mexicana]|uniref:uncharacterized protein LOC108547048 n=1 Tax=Eufriesea mexicana TaxID=516756 RepID=UPI00083BC837|nr:PREDICTED: uncharacterized protein LOC108547048 [Eufriesea mexicana]